MLIHLPVVVLVSLQATPVADAVPKFDIAQECKAESDIKAVQESCMTHERRAFDQLKKEWPQYGASEKAQCNREVSAAPPHSYVELLTCLEMARDANKKSRRTR